MLFSSTTFLAFFLPLLILIYFAVPRKLRSVRNFVLLAFSLVFYGWGGAKYLLLMLASIAINYFGGVLVGAFKSTKARKLCLFITVVLNLGLLVWFKYAGFFTEILNSLFGGFPVLKIALPIGISFFTFQGLSYVVDVYRNEAKVQKNPLYLALYISLFPQLVAGPIVRYTTVDEEIYTRRESLSEFSDGVVRFMFGFGKKMILANSAAEIADAAFASQNLSMSLSWVGALAYTAQIYFDFSAYSDMAIGLGKMFGFHFLENFNYPYIAKSVTDFWRRWHISLSTWFRDYVYIPLGGNRCSRSRHILNLLVVWGLTGFWHGASWNFIAWGLWFALFLIMEKYLFGSFLDKHKVLGHIYTMLVVVFGWVLFRAETLSLALEYAKAMLSMPFDTNGQALYYIIQYWPEWILFILCSMPVCRVLKDKLSKSDSFFAKFLLVWGVKAFALTVFALGYVKLVTGSFNPFIYFRF